jgi:hypothetical protein
MQSFTCPPKRLKEREKILCGGEPLGHWFFFWATIILETLESTNYPGFITAEYDFQG